VTKPEPVEELLSPTAPGHPAESAVIVDLAEVAPAGSGWRPLTLGLVSAAAGVSFLALTAWVAGQGASGPQLDHALHRWVVEHRTPLSLTVARAVTWGGVTGVVLPTLVAVGALCRRGGWTDLRLRLGSGALLAGVASVGVYLGLRVNALVGRVRPSVTDWAGTAGGPSFPSGHTTAATIFAASCAWALAGRVRAGWQRRALWAGAAAYAVMVGCSRVWLGVHWPTDVVGGWLFGVTWFAGTAAVIVALRRRTGRARRTPAAAQR
jgi:membrane-associated phospholipid phosphatase